MLFIAKSTKLNNDKGNLLNLGLPWYVAPEGFLFNGNPRFLRGTLKKNPATLVFNVELWLNSGRRKKSPWFLLIQWLFNKMERRRQVIARFPEELQARCSSILNDKELISLVEKSSSPSATYEMVFAETKDIS
jgi:hypothetical protein